jgi:Nif-specific regulatory protein
VRRFDNIIGESAAMRHLFDQVQKVIDTRATVLIEGETGTGKELIASALHYRSQRSDKLFVAQNCAALPETLLESELFGHKRGAFTGATEEKKGLFELADKGTMFLDEVTEMPLTLQAKLLRVLQEGEVRAVGSNIVRKVDVRVVAASNRDIETEVRAGKFREDLYYRLRVFPLRVPPLREREGDIDLLATFFLRRYMNEFAKPLKGFSPESVADMRAYRWPGNVRELENEVQRLVIQADPNTVIGSDILSPRIHHRHETPGILDKEIKLTGNLRAMTDEYERNVITEALRKLGNNKSATAKVLGITREGLHKKLKALGLGG